jgi:uncharacterized protein YjiS (DUF1127 family)
MNILTHPILTDYHPSAYPERPSLLARAAETLRIWRKRSRERRALAELDERDLHDFGATRVDVFAEVRRPFWRE